ncbi:hypothetical protein PIB30_021571 [Stylosanthes scabra]|uniref:Uncharacterized protein n=1 Tax=Stylosanthes scabra TaxID=79078 RepID=A0ABU6T8S3_9FABA|nr:hypothetical protein [Stylosanthes scabra]
MANHFLQYAVLLLITTSMSSSEACNKDGGGVGGHNCSSLQQRRCEDKLFTQGGCDEQWCVNTCALKHFGQDADGTCIGAFFNRPSGITATVRQVSNPGTHLARPKV